MTRSKIGAGTVAGIAAGVVFAALMQVATMPMAHEGGMSMPSSGRAPMITMFAQVVRSERFIAGWLYILSSSLVVGAIFGLVFGTRAARIGSGLGWGALYGVVLWVLGGLIVMPILLGMDALAPLTMASMRPVATTGLVGHLLSGLVLGGTFSALYERGPAAA